MKNGKKEVPKRVLMLLDQIEYWRRNRKKRSPMPEELWDTATRLAQKYKVSTIASIAKLDYKTLKRRSAGGGGKSYRSKKSRKTEMNFVEVPSLLSSSPTTEENVIELSDETGRKMTLRLPKSVEVDTERLITNFWDQR